VGGDDRLDARIRNLGSAVSGCQLHDRFELQIGYVYHPLGMLARPSESGPLPFEIGAGATAVLREPIIATSLADEIAFRIESAILEGQYPPGSRLPQDEMCYRFGVSRTPVREALRKLQARNLVVVTPNKGATVRTPTRKELMDVYAVRSELEGYACELAASRFSDETIAQLDEAQGRLAALVDRLERQRAWTDQDAAVHVQVNRANDDFHQVIHRASGNERLYQLAQELGRIFPKDYAWRAVRSSDEMHVLNLEEHVRIRGALAAGESATARREMRDHILHARSVLLRYLDDHGFWP
jgi:DNA-binding GntR family transcriptional regulator